MDDSFVELADAAHKFGIVLDSAMSLTDFLCATLGSYLLTVFILGAKK